MSVLFQWNDSYSVKVAALDNQHKKLFDLVNELHQAMKSGRGKDAMGEILRRLIDYTVHHFSVEEKLMEMHKYPEFVAHRAEHRALAEKVVAFKKELEADSGTVTLEVMDFLQQWLLNHIQRVDQGYSEFLNAQGVH